MKIQQHNGNQVLLAGRRQEKETGQEGLWLVWLVGTVMLAGGVWFAWMLTESGTRLSKDLSMLPPLMLSTLVALVALVGAFFLGMGIVLLLRRESLTLDLLKHTGTYRTWPPWSGSKDGVTRLWVRHILPQTAPHPRQTAPCPRQVCVARPVLCGTSLRYEGRGWPGRALSNPHRKGKQLASHHAHHGKSLPLHNLRPASHSAEARRKLKNILKMIAQNVSRWRFSE